MADWKPDAYLRFAKERTQPATDLAGRIRLENPARIVDIGCGPGNSTRVLKDRWPEASITGVDNSAAMLQKARDSDGDIDWIEFDVAGSLSQLGKFDVVFSNAALQWIPNKEQLIPKMFDMLSPGGAVAVQVPNKQNMPIHTETQRLVQSEKWSARFEGFDGDYTIRTPGYYYDILSALTEKIFLWETDYIHILDDHQAVGEFYKSSGLRPYLDYLGDEGLAGEFMGEYVDALRCAYPAQGDGKILFPFTRIFFVAYA